MLSCACRHRKETREKERRAGLISTVSGAGKTVDCASAVHRPRIPQLLGHTGLCIAYAPETAPPEVAGGQAGKKKRAPQVRGARHIQPSSGTPSPKKSDGLEPRCRAEGQPSGALR